MLRTKGAKPAGALFHSGAKCGSQVEQCYARSDVLERRREVVMKSWGAFLVE